MTHVLLVLWYNVGTGKSCTVGRADDPGPRCQGHDSAAQGGLIWDQSAGTGSVHSQHEQRHNTDMGTSDIRLSTMVIMSEVRSHNTDMGHQTVHHGHHVRSQESQP